jgi:hypothetical protein
LINSTTEEGQAFADSWVFGVVTTEFQPVKGYYQVVEKRDRDTLLPIIDTCLMHTNDWGAYDHLDQLLPNRVVNHSNNVVDPATGVHTQDIESVWNKLKVPIALFHNDVTSCLHGGQNRREQ